MGRNLTICQKGPVLTAIPELFPGLLPGGTVVLPPHDAAGRAAAVYAI